MFRKKWVKLYELRGLIAKSINGVWNFLVKTCKVHPVRIGKGKRGTWGVKLHTLMKKVKNVSLREAIEAAFIIPGHANA